MSDFQQLAPQQARGLIEQQQAIVVDIRDAASFNTAHITGAQPLNNDNLPTFLADTDKTKPIIVCCYHGNSSQQAAQFLCQQEFSEVYSLEGGFEYWRQFAPELCQSDQPA